MQRARRKVIADDSETEVRPELDPGLERGTKPTSSSSSSATSSERAVPRVKKTGALASASSVKRSRPQSASLPCASDKMPGCASQAKRSHPEPSSAKDQPPAPLQTKKQRKPK